MSGIGKFSGKHNLLSLPLNGCAWVRMVNTAAGQRSAAMARNSAQFRKGLGEAEFAMHYGTEKQWRAAVIAAGCGGCAFREVTTRRLLQCSACRHQTSLSAGRIFASSDVRRRVSFRAPLPSFEYPANRRYDRAPKPPLLTWEAVRTPPMPYRLLKPADVNV